MPVTLRNYSPQPFFSNDYLKVRQFFMRINDRGIVTPRMLWGAWEWAVTHSMLDRNHLDRIGLWEDDGILVGVAMYESVLGEGFLFTDEKYSSLKPEMVAYAKDNLHDNGLLRLLIPDGDIELQRSAMSQRFRPTQKTDRNAILDIDSMQSYHLPEGYTFVSLADEWDFKQYHQVMWRGFNHEGEPVYDSKTIDTRRQMLSSPMIIPEIVLAAAAPDGQYVSHCGMWYSPGEPYCYVEPVATIPSHRLKGLGKAVVLEAIRRCGEMGAVKALVGSGQQFYYNIGFYPIFTYTYWELVA